MWNLIIEGAIWIGLFIVNRLLQTRPTTQAQGNFLSLPRVEQGSAVPLVMGKIRVDSPILAWIGPIRESFDTTRNQSWYTADQLYVVGIPMPYNSDRLHLGPKLWNMWSGSRNLGGTGKIVDLTVYGYGAPMPLRGGQWTRVDDTTSDNMVQGGAMQFFDGQIMQGWSPVDGRGNGFEFPQDLSHSISTNTPGIVTRIATSMEATGISFGERVSYRNYMTVALTGLRTDAATAWNVGAVAQLPGAGFEVSSYGDFTANATGVPIGDDANPMDCLYTMLTSTWGCVGMDPAQINIASFQAASITLYNEGNGYSRSFNERTEATQIFSEILTQVDGALYKEPTTGQLTFKLIRADYDPFAIQQFSDALSNIVEVSDYQLSSWKDTYNRVELKYTSRANDYQTMIAIAEDQANQYGQAIGGLFDGKLRTMTIEMPGCCTQATAQKLAARTLATVARPLAKLTIVVNRDGINVRPGDPIMINYAEYNISGVFRVATVDFGQLFDNKITIDCLEDIFDNAGALMTAVNFQTKVLLPPYLIKTQEAPYFLARLVANLGSIADADSPHTMTLAAQSGTGTGYNTKGAVYRSGSAQPGQTLYDLTTIDGTAGPDAGYTGDCPNNGFQWYGTVETVINREDEPYMSSKTLRVTLVSGTPDADNTYVLITTSWDGGIPHQVRSIVKDTATQQQNIAQRAQFMFMVDNEIMAYESHAVDPINPNVIVFSGVWRGLLDTAPVTHQVGARVYGMPAAEGFTLFDIPLKIGGGLLKPSSGVIGRLSYGIGDIADVRVCPTSTGSSLIVDLGQQANDTFMTMSGRAFAPLPPADFGVSGVAVTGAVGLPARTLTPDYNTVTGATLYKRVDGFDEGFEVSARFRDRTSSVIVRGDAGDDSVLSTTTTYQLRALIVNYSVGLQNNSQLISFASTSSPSAHGINLSKLGHGPFDVQLRAQDFNATNLSHRNFQSPTVRVNAKRWRNLLVNSRGDYGDGTGWTLDSGSPWTVFSGSASLSKSPTSHYYRPSAAGVMHQQIDVTGFKPGGLLAIPTLYYFGGAGTDTLSVQISFYDYGNALISTATASNVVGGNAYWRRWDSTGGLSSQLIPQNCAQVRMTLTWSNGSSGLFVSDVQLRIGNVGLLGFSEAFDGATTTWTGLTLNSVAGNQYTNRVVSATRNVATITTTGVDGVSPISDRIIDDCDGVEYGTAVITFALAKLTAGTATGETILEVLNDSNVTLTTVTTGALVPSTVGVWERHELSVDLPDGAQKFRVRLKQTGTAQLIGWDDFDLRIYSQLARSTTTGINAQWFVPKRMYTPQTWPEYYQVHPLHPAPTLVMSKGATGAISSTDAYDQTFAWSDGLTRDAGKFTLISGAQNLDSLIPSNATTCYHFTRTTIISGIDVEVTSNPDALAAFDVGTSFSCSVLFRVDELTWAGACGLVGRRGSASGWSIEIDSTGHLIAALISPDGSKTVTRTSSTVIDGAMHLACIVYDATAQLLRIHDERGFDSVSTATGLGSFALTGSPFRLGRARLLTDVLPGDVLNCVLSTGALTTAQVGELWTYGQDSNNALTYARSGAAWSQAYPDISGSTLTKWSSDQLALAYDPSLSSYFEGAQYPGFGMPVQGPDINYAYTFDTTLSSRWQNEGLVTFDSTIVDPTGSPKGLRITVNDVTAGGLMLQTATLGQGTTVTLVFWARMIAGGPQLDLTLFAAGFPTVFATSSVQLTSSWQRYVVTFTGFTAGAVAAQIRMRLHNDDGGTTLGYPVAVWDMCHVYGVFQSNSAPIVPYLIPDAQFGSSATTISAAVTGGLHLASEGEIAIVGVAPNSSTDVPATGIEPANSAATIKQAAGGYGTFSAGWLCNDTVGNLVAAFGSPTLTASNLSYSQAGPFGNGDKAISFATAAGTAAGSSSDFDVTATDDLLIVWIGKWTSAPVVAGSIASKITGSASDGYFIGTTVTDYEFFVAHGGSQAGSTIGATYLSGRWHIGIAAVDRASGIGQMGVIALDDGSIKLGNQIPGLAATFTTTQAFSVGAGGFANAPTGFQLAGLYIAKGAGVATAVPTNMSGVLANLARNLPGGSIARLEVPSSLANVREIYQGFGGAPGLYHVAGDAVTGTRSQASTFTWSSPWTLRGRWGRLALFEDPSLHGAGIVQADVIARGPYANSNYVTPGGFSIGTTAPSVLRIGATCQPMLIGQVTVSVSPPKIAPLAVITNAFWDYP